MEKDLGILDFRDESLSPFISYIIPVHNAWPYLKFAIESVLEIDSNDFELIISDNHSTDSTRDYLTSLRDSRVRIVSPPSKLRMNSNFEFAVSHARGEWLQLIGGDDAVLPWHHQVLKKTSVSYPGIQVINWNRGYYFWAEAQHQNDNLVASIEISSRIRLLYSRKRLRQALRGTISFLDLPQLYTTSAVKRDLLIQAAKMTDNTFFVGMQPDIFSSIQILFNVEKYLRIECPLTLVGTSPKPTGPDFVSDFYKKDSDFVHEVKRCKSTPNARTSISLLTRKNSPYFLMDSLSDYFDSTNLPVKRSLMRMGFANFLSRSYFPLDVKLHHEILSNLKKDFPDSFFSRISIYSISVIYFVFIPRFVFFNRARNFILKKLVKRIEYKKVSYNPEEFISIKSFVDGIPQSKIKLLS